MSSTHIEGLAELAGRYRGFIIDLWGVVHDGVAPYDGALDCLRRLRAAGGRVVLLSNAPRRAAFAEAALARMGVTRALFDGIVTSGEATWIALAAYAGARVYHLGPDRDRNVLDGLPVVRVDHPKEADVVVNTGPDDRRDPTSIDGFLPELRSCLDSELPMICANPDLEVVSAGRRLVCAGALAQWYEARGGQVRWIGKPDPAVYDLVWPMLGDIDRGATLAIGDALRTDVAGARAVGVDACWILGGIHAVEDPASAWSEAAAAGLSPVATLPGLRW